MPYPEKKRWTHRYDTANGSLATTWSASSWRVLEDISGATNFIRKIRGLRAHLALAMEDPAANQGDFEEGVWMFALAYRESSLGASVISVEDTQAIWRPQIVPFVTAKDFVTSSQSHRLTLRWSKLTIPENYTLSVVVSATTVNPSTVHYALAMHWLEQREAM